MKSNLRCGAGERQKTQDMTLRTFLGYFFYSEMTERSIESASQIEQVFLE